MTRSVTNNTLVPCLPSAGAIVWRGAETSERTNLWRAVCMLHIHPTKNPATDFLPSIHVHMYTILGNCLYIPSTNYKWMNSAVWWALHTQLKNTVCLQWGLQYSNNIYVQCRKIQYPYEYTSTCTLPCHSVAAVHTVNGMQPLYSPPLYRQGWRGWLPMQTIRGTWCTCCWL